jgi:hypothetical protein
MWNNILNTLKKGDQKAVFQEMLLAVKRWSWWLMLIDEAVEA